MSDYNFLTGCKQEADQITKKHHYSGRVPSVNELIVTAHENGGLFGNRGRCVAACYFSIPAARWDEEVYELMRLVRTPDCDMQLTRLISVGLTLCRKNDFDLLVSYADQSEGHHGGIYQAASWNYHEKRGKRMEGVYIDGDFLTGRKCNHKYGTQSPEKIANLEPEANVEPAYDEGKHLYWKATKRSGEKKADRLGLESNEYPKPDREPVPA